MEQKRIIVIGGGWAGLTTAIELSGKGHKVTLLEAAKQLGGRARTTVSNGMVVDNGQHLMIGAYTEMLRIMDTIGVKESDVFLRKNLFLKVQGLDSKGLNLRAPTLPAPLNLLAAFLQCRELSLRERIVGIMSTNKLISTNIEKDKDYSVTQLLNNCGIPKAVQKNMHIPLCIAALNTPPDSASARVFIRTMKETFKSTRGASDFLLPKKDLTALFAAPAQEYLKAHDVKVHVDTKVSSLIVKDEQICGVILANDTRLAADAVVVATHYPQAIKLLKTLPYTKPTLKQLEHFEGEPIITLYFQFEPEVKLPKPMIGVVDGYSEWVIDRRIVGEDGLLAVVISATGRHSELSRSQLAIAVLNELKELIPNLGQPKDVLVLKDSPATFACSVGIDDKRPSNETCIKGCWLAGDYTDTELPATLEGAIRSGMTSAQSVLRYLEQ